MFKTGEIVCLKSDRSVRGKVIDALPHLCEVRLCGEEKTDLYRTEDLVSYADVLFNHTMLYDHGDKEQ